eukprot:NODE_5676_length_494_cov_169.233708_g4242_i0.p2 GENE.NODE_5676_length_494_cov_169.233708_g4242_i0~~NODE_5676_length_494_cov_169.233708_g4242_i0.p2  ORF type:complete len:80 (-),score=26.49 NODE_5676_length_494_cov_169.233708_g4242_i0:122-361(-)
MPYMLAKQYGAGEHSLLTCCNKVGMQLEQDTSAFLGGRRPSISDLESARDSPVEEAMLRAAGPHFQLWYARMQKELYGK